MRSKLAEAAYDVIAERGHSAFRTAAVITRAGVSQGALLHHFPTKDDLTLAAIDFALSRSNAVSMDRLGRAAGSREAIVTAMVDDFRDFFLGDNFWVSLDITMDASKDPAVAPAIRAIVRRARAPVYAAWAERLADCGWELAEAEELVVTTAAIVSGHAIRTLWADDDAACERAIDRWTKSLLSHPLAGPKP